MSYIYHFRPDPFEGTSLIPLNMMDKSSDLFKRHIHKYKGREELMSEIIPVLNCKWNDVVQFSGLNPKIIIEELSKYQKDLHLKRFKYFKVDIRDIISRYNAVIFDRDTSRGKGNFAIQDNEIKKLTEENYQELTRVPEKTISYWENVKVKGGQFLLFPFITHVMVKGIIETKDFEVCELRI